jgi:hypothetical protein
LSYIGATTYTFAKFLFHRSATAQIWCPAATRQRFAVAVLLAGLSLRRQGWHWQSGKLSMLGMFALRWVAAKVDGGPKRAVNAAYGPTDVAGEPE